MRAMIEREGLVSEKEIFLENLGEILRILDTKGIDYRLVGGLAADAYSGNFCIRRSSGGVRDVDMIVLSTDRDLLDAVRKEIKAAEVSLKSADLFPKVSLNQAYREGVPFRTLGVRIPAILSGFMEKEGKYYLTFNEIEREIPSKIMMKTFLNIEGLVISSFCPETILHLYLARGGSLKQKDLPKLFKLARKIALSPTPGLSHTDFLVFHRFAKEMRLDYPGITRMFKTFFVFDQLLGNRLSGSDRLVYNLWQPIQQGK